MLEQLRQAGVSNEAIEAALIEAASQLGNSIGEAVPLHDYRVSVEVFASALSHTDLQAVCEEVPPLFDIGQVPIASDGSRG
jgi:hypothetical protein